MLRSEFSGEVMVFSREHNGRTFYTIGLSKKKQDGEYLNGYLPASFKKGVELPNKTKIEIKKAWLDFYVNKENHTIPGIFIAEFETEHKEPEVPEGFAQLDDEDIPF